MEKFSTLSLERSIAFGLVAILFASVLVMASFPVSIAASDFFDATQRTASTSDKMDPQLQVAGDNIYYVWYESDGSYWQIWTAGMKTDGTGWSATKRTTSSYSKWLPQLQVVGENIYYVWSERDGNYLQIWTASMKTDDSDWSATKRTTSASHKWAPQFQVVGDNIYYVWQGTDNSQYPKYQIWTASMGTDGSGWSATQRTSSASDKYYPQLQVVGDKIYYVWVEFEGSYGQIWTGSVGTDGSGWSATQRTSSAYSKWCPQLQVVGDRIYYVWFENDESKYQIWTASIRTDGSGWSATQRTTSAYSKWYPQLQIVGDYIHYVWIEGEDYRQMWTASMKTDGSDWIAVQRMASDQKFGPQLYVLDDSIYYVLSESDGAYTQIWTAMTIVPPPAPLLVYPKNNAELLDNTPTFEWTSVYDPSGVTYQIQIDNDANFSSPVYSAIDLADNTHTLPDASALVLGRYYWHVRAKSGAGITGDWSQEWDFTVVPIGTIGILLMPLLMLLPFALVLRRQSRRYSMR